MSLLHSPYIKKYRYAVTNWACYEICLSSLMIFYYSFLQVEGKGNGVKTVIVNMSDIAKSLNRPATCKWLVFC